MMVKEQLEIKDLEYIVRILEDHLNNQGYKSEPEAVSFISDQIRDYKKKIQAFKEDFQKFYE